MENVDQRIIDYAKTCKNGEMTTDGFKASIDTMSFSAKAGAVALKALSIAGNMLLMWGITKVFEVVTQEIYNFIHASEIAREKSTELTSQWKEENSSIDDSISKYKELKEKLDDTSLSASEIKDIKEELLGVQDDLVEKYGNEAIQIDLVNGKYDEQIAKLEKLSKLKAQEYVAENYSNVQADRTYVTEKVNLNRSLGFKGSVGKPDDYSNAGFDLKKFLDKYDKLHTKVSGTSSQFGVTGDVTLVTDGTREEVYNQLVQLENDLIQAYGKENEDVNKFLGTLSEIINEEFDTSKIDESKNNLKEYATAEIMSQDDTRQLYSDAIDAVEEYNNALQSCKGVDAAKANLESVQQSVKDATSDIEGAEDVFDDIYSGINKTADNKYKVDQAFKNNKAVQSYAEALRGLSEDDLQKIDFEDFVLSPGEEAFGELIDILGLSEDEVQALIDKLIELGIVQGNISDEIADKTTISSFTDAWEQLKSSTDDATKDLSNTLTELAEQGRLTIDAFNEADSTDYFENLGISADEAVQKINALVSSSTQLQSMSAQISKMSDMLADKKNGNAAKASDLAGFDAEVRGLDSWKEFESVMGSSKSTMEQCQEAANNLATEWINSGNYLSNLTEKNKDYYITALQNMGVENAEEIVKNALTLATQAQSAAEEFLAQKKRETSNETYSLIDATAEEITKFAEEKGYAYNVTNALIELALKKQLVNGTTLDFSGDLANISNYVKALGGTANAIGLLNRIKKGEVYMPGDAMASVIASAQAEIDAALVSGTKTNVRVNPSGSSGYKPSNPSDKGKNSETKDTKQAVDWIERKLSVLNDKIALTQSKFESLFNIKSPKNLSNKIKQTTKELQKAEKASSKWKNALGKIKISDSLKKDIQGGKKIDLSKYSKAEQKEIKKYQSAYKNYANAKKKENTLNDKLWGLQTSTGKDNNLKSQIKQYEALADAYDKAAEKYKKYADKVKLSSSLKKKVQTGDYNIADYSSETQKLIQEYEDLWKKYKDALKGKQESKQSANDKREERYQLYVDDAESKIAKSQAYAELDAGNYKKQNAHLKAQKGYIKESYKYQIKIAKLNKDSVEAAKLKAELQKELNDLTMQEFDNIANTYDKQIGLNDNKIRAFQDQISLLEAKGQKAGSALYSKQISLNNVNEKKLVAEREKLISKLSEIPKGTDDWYDAQDKLFSVESELVNIQTENANLQKSINQLKFDRFDDLIGKLNDVVDETNFLKDMLDSDHLFDDNGMITDDGLTAIGLTAQNYDTYLAEAEKYKQMQEDLEKMYANGEIGIADYESMMREYKQGQMDAIKSANDAKKAVIDYVKQGLDAQNEALSEAIDKQKELLRSEKDLYDFQQKIASQNKNIADLQKQINALEGDDSEENRKRLQQLKAELAEAEQEQKDTLYDRSISDQEDALDQMLKNSQEQAENYLKDTDKVLADAFVYVNEHTSQIANNIEAIAKETGYDISTYIVSAWKNSGDAVGYYSNALSSATPNILSQIDLITQKWNEQTTAIEKASQAAASLVTDSYLDYTRAGASGNSSSGRIEMSQKIEDLSDKKHTGNLVDADNISRSHALTKGQIDAFLMLRNITPPTNIPAINIPSHVNTNIPVPNRTPMNINIDSSVHVDGVATDKIVQDMAGVAKKQAENVISEINRRTYAKGVRWR